MLSHTINHMRTEVESLATDARSAVDRNLGLAFPLPPSGTFEDLLGAIDKAELARRRRKQKRGH